MNLLKKESQIYC